MKIKNGSGTLVVNDIFLMNIKMVSILKFRFYHLLFWEEKKRFLCANVAFINARYNRKKPLPEKEAFRGENCRGLIIHICRIGDVSRLLMVLILAGISEHVAHVGRKTGLF